MRELSSSCCLLLPFLSLMNFSRLSLFMVNSAIVLFPVQIHFSTNLHLICTYNHHCGRCWLVKHFTGARRLYMQNTSICIARHFTVTRTDDPNWKTYEPIMFTEHRLLYGGKYIDLLWHELAQLLFRTLVSWRPWEDSGLGHIMLFAVLLSSKTPWRRGRKQYCIYTWRVDSLSKFSYKLNNSVSASVQAFYFQHQDPTAEQ